VLGGVDVLVHVEEAELVEEVHVSFLPKKDCVHGVSKK
jgi:hypothetical protein